MQILDADPRLFGPRYYLGLMRLQQGRHDDACDYLGEAVKILPDETGALMNYGVALRAAGRGSTRWMCSSACWRYSPAWRRRSTTGAWLLLADAL